jgi:hypothetical protein
MDDIMIRLLVKTRSTGNVCRGCGAALDWYVTLRGRSMPMNAGAQPRSTYVEDNRTVGMFAAADAHWRTCPEATRFKTVSR